MRTRPIKPTVIWKGTTRNSEGLNLKARAVILSHPNRDDYGFHLTYKIEFEVGDGVDAMGVQRWQPYHDAFPEFLNHLSKEFLKQKGATT